MAHLAQIWRYPIKSIGRERLSEVTLSENALLPFDRHWAVTHEKSKVDPNAPTWEKKLNFLIGFSIGQLQAITCEFDEKTHAIKLRHPQAGQIEITLHRDNEAELITWLKTIIGETSWIPQNLVQLETGFSDQDEALISINSLSSLEDLSQHFGQEYAPERWRGNLWIEGWAPWAEFEMLGKKVQIGEAILEIIKPIERCRMTSVNPQTGEPDTNMPINLRAYKNHQDFGVFAKVIKGGQISEGMQIT